ncbi:unnamed protein product [Paramecium pentaurelia]|uniref:Uncharacterized protein n=1 Tax=Paramecium pentaurelia TaxID=43138 RepID=A0A8S1UML8_9CILI|nr:unnamed protein product [Paramecium pentaurelia]
MTDFQLCKKLFCFEQKWQEHGTINIEVEMWDQIKTQITKMKIQIIKTQDNEIIYVNDGIILRVQSLQDVLNNPQNFTNLEQIQKLQWKKENEINMMKIVKSMAFWNGKVLKDVGGYFLDGQKQGFWREIIDNYWSQAEVYVIGEYNKNKKVGVWKYIFHNNIIGLGQYNYQGQRIAKWIQLRDRFSN